MFRFLSLWKRTPFNDLAVERFNVGIPEREILGLSPHQIYPTGPLEDVDPVLHSEPGVLTSQTAVGTIGSCFAAELKKWMVQRGFNVVQTEEGPGSECGPARFGFVLNTACLRQLFQSAYGQFKPTERWWRHKDRWLDPYRKSVAWPDESAAVIELEQHALAVRRAVEQLRVLIVTVGTAEVWRSREDGATFYQVPPKDVFDPTRHEFVLTTVAENLANLAALHSLLHEHNPQLRMIIMLSPLAARATSRTHLSSIEADEISKATLRVAIDQFCTAHPQTIYFPAYEIARRLSANAFRPDNRHLCDHVIDRIMTTLVRHYG